MWENNVFTDDDGSTLTLGADGSVSATPALYPVDVLEQSRIGSVLPRSSEPWWETALRTGVPRVIDSHFRDKELERLSKYYPNGAGLVGASGRTTPVGVVGGVFGGMSQHARLLTLVALAGLAFVLLKR